VGTPDLRRRFERVPHRCPERPYLVADTEILTYGAMRVVAPAGPPPPRSRACPRQAGGDPDRQPPRARRTPSRRGLGWGSRRAAQLPVPERRSRRRARACWGGPPRHGRPVVHHPPARGPRRADAGLNDRDAEPPAPRAVRENPGRGGTPRRTRSVQAGRARRAGARGRARGPGRRHRPGCRQRHPLHRWDHWPPARRRPDQRDAAAASPRTRRHGATRPSFPTTGACATPGPRASPRPGRSSRSSPARRPGCARARVTWGQRPAGGCAPLPARAGLPQDGRE
jgi:hypothetical protein